MISVGNADMTDTEYVEYRCSACKKEIKSLVVQCKACVKLFYHPGCAGKHRIYNKVNELVKCEGPFEQFSIESGKVEMKKTPTVTGSGRERTGSTGSAGSASNATGSANKPSGMEAKIDWLVRTVKEMRDEMACKKEIKTMIQEIVREELGSIKQEFEEIRKSIQEGLKGPSGDIPRSYCEAVRERKKESVIIVKPKGQQESEVTKQVVKEKIDIKKMAIGVTKLRKGSKGTVILGCESEEEMKKLKTTVQDKMGTDYKIMEPRGAETKLKIINVGEEEMKLEEEDIINTIKRQNKLNDEREGFYMKIVKKIMKGKKDDGIQQRREKGDGSIILVVDEDTHERMLKEEKVNIGWRRCFVVNYINVKRCFNCWGYYHIAKNCTRSVTCHKCAGNHKEDECKATKKRCVNCMYKNKTYNLKIGEEHDTLSWECPTYKRALEEERKRIGCEKEK